MTLTDQQVRDIVDELCAQANIRREWRVLKLRERSAGPASLPALAPIVERYLAIVDPAPLCQVEHDHWEGKMICGNPLPCRTHGGR
jgi:hypothetical protein